MTAKILVTIVALVVLGGVLLGCAGPAPTPAAPTSSPAAKPTPSPAPAPAPTSTPAPAPKTTPTPIPTLTPTPTPTPLAKKLVWKFTSYTPPTDITTIALNHFADLMKERSGGRLEIMVTPGGALVSVQEAPIACKSGVVDGGFITFPTWYGKFPLGEGAEGAPFAFSNDTWDPKAAKMREVRSIMNRELKAAGWNMMWIWNNHLAPTTIFLRKPFTSLYDLKGRKLRTPGGVFWDAFFQEVGAVPVTTASSEIYLSVERGVVDGFTLSYSSYATMKLYEVGSYAIAFNPYPLSGAWWSVLLNLDSFNKLPGDVQKILLETSGEMDVWAFEQAKAAVTKQLKELGTLGVTLLPPPQSELDNLIRKVVPAWQAEFTKKTGDPGREIMKLVTELSPYWK